MTNKNNIRLSRRKLLAGLGAVGVASAGAGLGTTAYFSDTESFANNTLSAGELDLKVGWQQTYTGLNPTTGTIGTHNVNAFPDNNGDGIQSTRGLLYGITFDERLYVIDLQEDEAIYVADTVGSSTSPSSPNGIAFDPDNRRLYYSVDPDVGTTGSPVELWFYDLVDDQQVLAGQLQQQAAGAGWYDGRYWYFHNETDDLYAVSFAPDGTIASGGETLAYGDISGDERQYRFGDLAANADGLLYGSSLGTNGSTAELFTVDLTDGTYTELYTPAPGAWSGDRDPTGLQLAVDDVGALFGQEAGSGSFFEIDPAAQTVTELGSVEDLRFTDLTQRQDLLLVCTRPDPVVPDAFRTDGFNPTQERLVELSDVKPGDSGLIRFTLYLCDNPGYVWLTGDDLVQSGGATTEPEAALGGSDAGELADNILVTVWYDTDRDGEHDAGEQLIFGPGVGGYTDLDGSKPATLSAAFEVLGRNGGRIPLDGRAPFMGFSADETDPERDCLPGRTTLDIGFAWELPVNVGNEVQGDTLGFDLGFYTEQCRHNPGPGRGETLTDESDEDGDPLINVIDPSYSASPGDSIFVDVEYAEANPDTLGATILDGSTVLADQTSPSITAGFNTETLELAVPSGTPTGTYDLEVRMTDTFGGETIVTEVGAVTIS